MGFEFCSFKNLAPVIATYRFGNQVKLVYDSKKGQNGVKKFVKIK